MNKLTEGIIKLKWPIVIIVVLLTAFFGYQLKDIKINADIISSLPDDDPVALLYKNIGKEFGGNDLGMIALETENIFTKEVIGHIKQITDTLKYTDGISTVTSLTDVIDIKGSEWGIEIGKLVDEYDMPDTQQELDSLKFRVFSKEMYKGSIVSEDGTSTLIMFTMLDDVDKQQLAFEIKEKITKLNLPEKLYFGGLPMMMNDVSDLIMSDIVRLIPIVFLLIAFILLISFRTTRGVILPLLTAAISVIWTLGIMTLFGYEITMISNLIPVILLAIGSAYTIHVLNRINQCVEKDRKKALQMAVAYIITPVILAAVTTVIGFVSFVFGAYLTMIQDFGIFTALGVFFALLLSIFFVPALISAFSMFKSANRLKKNGNMKFNILSNKILLPLKNILFKHPKYILTAWFLLLLLTISGIFMIQRSVNMADYFKRNNPTRVTEDIMQKKFGGSLPVYVVIKGDIQSPEVLKMMKKTQDYMETIPGIDKTQSVADLIEEMNDVMGEGKRIPEVRAQIENLWFLIKGEDIMEQLVTKKLDKAIIQSKFASADSKLMTDFEYAMETFVTENSTEECKIEVTGMPAVYVRLDSSLIDSQISSLIIAIIMVLVIVGLLLRSVAKGIYATIPIIATIIILFGFMGLTGIPLDIATVLVASIALGIGIDYSIHIITHFNHSFNGNGDINKAIEETIMVSGKAIIINVVSVAAGFLVLLFSELVPLQNFGLLVALSMIGSGLGALTLLPVILILANRKRKFIKS
ncbi:MAG: MMPL family transporter [Desulfobacula sp.]|nr:MMPL family transporter [Desulfobacula sp.]